MKTIAVYARISTTDQNTEGQVDQLQKWLESSAIKLEAVEWFIDKETGNSFDRPEFNRMQKLIAAKQIKTVVCWKLDRIGRNMIDGMNVVANWTENGVRVISTTQAIDVSGTMGKIIAAMLFGFAQLETEYRKERQAVGIEAAKRRGVYRGRQSGTTKARPARAAELKARGLKIEEIATAMGTSLRTVHRYLAAD